MVETPNKLNESFEVIEEDGMVGDPNNGVPYQEVDPATGETIAPSLENDTPKYDALTTVQQALEAKPVEFEKSVNGMLADRLQAAVEKRREEIASSIFNSQDEEPTVTDTNAEEGSEEDSSEPVEDEETPSEE